MVVNRRFFDDMLKDRQISLRTMAKRMDMLPSQLSLTFSGKRRMQITEAIRISQILGVPVNEVMVNAGIEEARVGRRRSTVAGILNGLGHVMPATELERTIAPEGMPEGCTAIQARTADSPLSWLDGFVIFCDAQQAPEDMLGRFCWAKITDGPEVLAVIRRGYTPGTFNLSGPFTMESQRLDWVRPALITRH